MLRPIVPREIGHVGVLCLLPMLSITFMGFAEISAISEEIRNPSRNLPLAIVGSVVLVTVIYCAIVFCIVGLKSWNDPDMAKKTVLMDLARQLMGRGGYGLMLLGGILATVSSANASIMAASRISFAMGRDGLMPSGLNHIHAKFKTPYRSILVTSVLTVAALIGLGHHIEIMAEVAGFLSLILYAFTVLACMVMRHANVEWYRPSFKLPGYPVVPLLALGGCMFVALSMDRISFIIGALMIAASLVWYVMFMRGQAELVGASNQLWHEKVVEPLVARAEEFVAARRDEFPVILVPLANPETERSLLTLSAALAKASQARLHLIHVVTVPMQTSLEAGRMEFERERQDKETLLDTASRHAKERGVRARANAVVAHHVPTAILSAAGVEHADTVVMGWRGQIRSPRLRQTTVANVLHHVDTSVLALKDSGLENVKRILVPISGGPHARYGLHVAKDLAAQWDASITALKVQIGRGMSAARSDFDRESLQLFQGIGEDFVRGHLAESGVEADVRVVVAPNIARAIIDASTDHDLIIIGASDEWALRRRLFGSIPDRVANEAKASVLMARASTTHTA